MNYTYSLSQWLVKYRKTLLYTNLLLATIFCTQIPNVQIGNTDEEFGHNDDPYVIQNQLISEVFEDESNKLFIIVATNNHTVLNTSNIHLIRSITQSALNLPLVLSVRSITNTNTLSVHDNELDIESLVPDKNSLTKDDIEKIRVRIQKDPELNRQLLSEDFTLSPIVISYKIPEDLSYTEKISLENNLLDKAQDIIDSANYDQDDVKILKLGWSVSFLAQLKEMENILFYITPFILIISCSAFWFLIKSVRALIWGLVSLVVLSEVFVFGMAGGLGIPLHNLSAIGPAIVIMVMGADSVHVMSMFFQNIRKGQAEEDAMRDALSFNLLPIFLTTLTTTLGFLSLNFSGVEMVRDLGNITAFGTAIAFFITISVMPALLLMRDNQSPVEPLTLTVLMNKLGKYIIKHQKVIFYGMSVLIIFFLWGLTSLHVNYFPGKHLDKGHIVRDSIDFVDSRLPIRYPAIYVFDSGEEEGVYQPEFLANVDKFAQWNRQQPEVLNVNSYIDLVKMTHKKMNGDLPEFETVPDSEDQIAQYMLLLDIMGFGDTETLGISEDASKLKLTILTKSLSTLESYDIESRASNWLTENTPNLNLYAIGGSYTWPHIFTKALYDLIEGALYALIAITLILIVAFRSLPYGILSIIPNLFPALVVFGIWSYLVGYITFIEACIFSITIGIVVDDTVHFISKYLTHRKLGLNYEEAIIKTFETVGTALVITTVTFTIGLFILLVSYLHQITLIVKLMIPILYMALILDFFYLPALLLRFENFTKKHLDKLSNSLRV